MIDQDIQFTGKYENNGRIAKWLIGRFYKGVMEMLSPLTAGENILEVGCGAGYSTRYISSGLLDSQSLQATDISESLLSAAQKRNVGVEFFQASAYDLPLPSKSIDTVIMLEVLEHLENPDLALSELARVSRSRVIISTPREPLWRAMNLARGKYMTSLGNTPGHIQHWSCAGLKRQVNSYFQVECERTPTPWTILRLCPR